MSTPPDTLQRLRSHRLLADVPEHELEWLVEYGAPLHLEVGDRLVRVDEPVDFLHIILEGHVVMYLERGHGRRKAMEWRGGDVTGILPYSRLVNAPGNSYTEVPTEVWTVPRGRLPELMRECPEFTARLVHVMLERARRFTSSDHQDEKTLALGKLAAGLAHELNNPASAIARSAKALITQLAETDRAGRDLAGRGLDASALAALDSFKDVALQPYPGALDPLDRSDREDALLTWLDDLDAETAPSSMLVDSAVNVADLDALASALPPEALDSALAWITTGGEARKVASEIGGAADRVFEMVNAVKGYTHMDEAMFEEPVDVHKGIQDAVTLLRAKAGDRSVTVDVSTSDGLPNIEGIVAELNQVWHHLIDNALDAVAEHGSVDVAVTGTPEHIVVKVADNGSGIPREVRDRIFDPFFTTKDVGAPGLGLDLARRIVRQHGGEIDFETEPGRTVFRVKLPT